MYYREFHSVKEHMQPGSLKQAWFYTTLMISTQVHFLQTGLCESGDIIVSILSEAILGNWIHYWIGSLRYLTTHEGFTKSVLTPFFARCTSIFLIFSLELLPDQTLLEQCQYRRFRKGNNSLYIWKYRKYIL